MREATKKWSFQPGSLGTNAGGTPEIIEDGVQGYVYPVREAGQDVLMDSLENLALDSNLRKKMGEAARECASLYFSKNIYLEKLTQSSL